MADAIKLKNLKTQNEKVPLKKNFSGTFSLFTSLIKNYILVIGPRFLKSRALCLVEGAHRPMKG